MEIDVLRRVARQEADVFGGNASVNRYHHDDSDLSVDILQARPSPGPGLSSYGTVGMSAFDSRQALPSGLLRVELVGAAQDRWSAMPSGIASCAFNLGTGEYGIQPEVVFPNVFGGYQPEVTTPHALIWQPFLWPKPFENIVAGDITITWLMAIPIADSELDFIRDAGVLPFIDRLEESQADSYDMSRSPIL